MIKEYQSCLERLRLALQLTATLNAAPLSSAGKCTYTLQASGTSCNLVLLPYGN